MGLNLFCPARAPALLRPGGALCRRERHPGLALNALPISLCGATGDVCAQHEDLYALSARGNGRVCAATEAERLVAATRDSTPGEHAWQVPRLVPQPAAATASGALKRALRRQRARDTKARATAAQPAE